MDPKKQNLTPELKQIYDRVMNTQVSAKPGVPQAPTTPAVPNASVPPSATSAPIATPTTPPPPVEMPPIPGSSPATPPAQAMNTPVPAAPPPVTPIPAATTPSGDSSQGQNYLSSVPPRAVPESKPFVFTGNKVQGQKNDKTQGKENKGASPAGGKKISTPIIGALVVVLIVVWGVFWAKLLGLF